MRYIHSFLQRCHWISLLILMLVVSPVTTAQSSLPTDETVSIGRTLPPALLPEYANLSSRLKPLLQTADAPRTLMQRADRLGVMLAADNTVQTTVTVLPSGSPARVEQALYTLGADNITRYSRWIDADIPIEQLAAASHIADVSLVQPRLRVYTLQGAALQIPDVEDTTSSAANPRTPTIGTLPQPSINGTVQSEGVVASGADKWHRNGYRGEGITIGVMDSYGYGAATQATGNLPPSYRIQQIEPLINADSAVHGTAVMEIIYDIAPGVNFIVTTPLSAVEMAQTIERFAQMGVQIINSSFTYFNTSAGDGTGPVSQAVANVTVNYDVLYVQAAGNQAEQNFTRAFADTDGDCLHNFAGSAAELNTFTATAGETIYLWMRWNDWATADTDYDLYLYHFNGATWQIVASSTTLQSGTQPPTEEIVHTPAHTGNYGWAVHYPPDRNTSSPGNAVIDVMGGGTAGFTYNDSRRSLLDPATGNYALSVTGVEAQSPYPRASYSSVGPSLGWGGTLDVSSATQQPRLAAYTSVSTYSWQAQNGELFTGTSAAAPHVAGAAALVRSAFPSLTALQTRTFLEQRAIGNGYSYYQGYGRLHMGHPPNMKTPTSHLPDTGANNSPSPAPLSSGNPGGIPEIPGF